MAVLGKKCMFFHTFIRFYLVFIILFRYFAPEFSEKIVHKDIYFNFK